MQYPNRVVAFAAAALSLALAVVPVVGNFDWQSTAGILAGIGAIAAVALKWLHGWQLHEGRLTWTDDGGDDEHPAVFSIPATDPAKVAPDEGDPGQPTAKLVKQRKKPVKR